MQVMMKTKRRPSKLRSQKIIYQLIKLSTQIKLLTLDLKKKKI